MFRGKNGEVELDVKSIERILKQTPVKASNMDERSNGVSANVPQAKSRALLSALKEAGGEAGVIGTVPGGFYTVSVAFAEADRAEIVAAFKKFGIRESALRPVRASHGASNVIMASNYKVPFEINGKTYELPTAQFLAAGRLACSAKYGGKPTAWNMMTTPKPAGSTSFKAEFGCDKPAITCWVEFPIPTSGGIGPSQKTAIVGPSQPAAWASHGASNVELGERTIQDRMTTVARI